VKYRRLRWAEMRETRNAYRILVGNPLERRHFKDREDYGRES